MTSINIELYQALIEAGTSPSTATAAAKVIRDIDERISTNTIIGVSENIVELKKNIDTLASDNTKIKTDIWWIKTVGGGAVTIIIAMLSIIISKI